MSYLLLFSQYEPVIQPGNEGIVHHIAVSTCFGDVPDEHDGTAWDCIEDIMPDYQCGNVMFVWAVGGNVNIWSF